MPPRPVPQRLADALRDIKARCADDPDNAELRRARAVLLIMTAHCRTLEPREIEMLIKQVTC